MNDNKYNSVSLDHSANVSIINLDQALINPKIPIGSSLNNFSSNRKKIYELKETLTTKKQYNKYSSQIINKEEEEAKNNNFNKFCFAQFKNAIKKYNNEIISSTDDGDLCKPPPKREKLVSMKDLFQSTPINEKVKKVKEGGGDKKQMKKMYLNDPQCELNIYQKIQHTTKLISDYSKNAPVIQGMRAEYILSKYQKSIKQQKDKVNKIQKGLRSQDEIIESQDTVAYYDVRESELKKNIYGLLRAKGNKLNQLDIGPETFYKNFENRINFLQDVYQVPYFKNNLINYFHSENKAQKLCEYQNYIEHGIVQYLNVLKVKIQREKDELIEEEKRKKNASLTVKEEKKEEEEVNENNIEKLLLTLDQKDEQPISQEEQQKNLNLYELEDFFIHKYARYESINLSCPQARDIILNGFVKK